MFELFRDVVLDVVVFKSGEGFLDIGCGVGVLILVGFKLVGFEKGVWGVDIFEFFVVLV